MKSFVPRLVFQGLVLPGFRQQRGAGRLGAANAHFGRHKMIKSRVMGLSKAGSRWYIPLAPKGVRPGCLLRKPPDGIDRRLRALAKSVSASVFCKGAQWFIAGWSSPVARQAHNLKVVGSNPNPATKLPSENSRLGKHLTGCCLEKRPKQSNTQLTQNVTRIPPCGKMSFQGRNYRGVTRNPRRLGPVELPLRRSRACRRTEQHGVKAAGGDRGA